jgi:hypothetical protein
MHYLLNLERFKIHIKIHTNVAPTCFGLRPSSGSLYWAWLKLYVVVWQNAARVTCSQVRRVWGILHCCHVVLCYAILHQNQPVCWSIVWKKKSTVDSPFFGTFHSDRIPKATNGFDIQFFVHSSNSCTLHHRIPVNYTIEFRNFLKLIRMFAVSLLIT